MKMAPCWTGSILHVDLTNNQVEIENQSPEFYRKYGGGSGMGMYYILREMPPKVDAFSPENVLTLFVGPLTGLPISGNARLSANAKSPAGGAIGDSQVGGYFPASMKFAGFDGIVVKGRAVKPVYLYLNQGTAELRDASHLWGKPTADVDEILRKELGDRNIEVLQCGPAGENLVRFAAIMTMANRACGRTGMGAVMGYKRLKAVVAHGDYKVEAADMATIIKWAKWAAKALPDFVDLNTIAVYGSAGTVGSQNVTGTLPTHNFSQGQFAEFENLTGERMTDTILKKRDTCYACVVRCKRVVETEYMNRKVLRVYGGPEYETVSTLGSYCEVGDLNAVALGNQLCNMYGLDTISTGSNIAFAMECFENGLLTTQDTDGIDLRFGNADAMLEMIERIALRKGFGDVLAEGSNRVAQKIGGKASDFLTTVKGTEAPAHMPHAKKTLSLIYAVNPFGADHQSHEMDPIFEEGVTFDKAINRLAQHGFHQLQPVGSLNDEKVRFTYFTELYYSGLDSYNFCQYPFGPFWNLYAADETIDLLQAATGWDVTIDEYLKVGERRLNMMRTFNMREGFDRSNDILPKKLYKALVGTGPTSGVFIDEKLLEHNQDYYYELAGFDIHTGNPTKEKLRELGLDWIDL
jgi:aldehyde:ferredoxin oxidoreductase